jgi:hypothetical protein
MGNNTSIVPFPNMTATDNFTPEPTINCTGAFVGSPRVFLAKDATAQSGVFPVSGTATTVTCTARDEAGNAGTATFRVTVACEAGSVLASGTCRGEAAACGQARGLGCVPQLREHCSCHAAASHQRSG